MDHRYVPYQVLHFHWRNKGYAVWCFAIWSKEARRFFGTEDVHPKQGSSDNLMNGEMTQRMPRRPPVQKSDDTPVQPNRHIAIRIAPLSRAMPYTATGIAIIQ